MNAFGDGIDGKFSLSFSRPSLLRIPDELVVVLAVNSFVNGSDTTKGLRLSFTPILS